MNIAVLTSMPSPQQYQSYIVQLLPIALLIVVFYFMLIRPQRKRDKAERDMRSSIQVGDEISTIGGIIGKVVSIKDETIIVESTSDRTKIKLYRWAIRAKETGNQDTPAPESNDKSAS